jgi:SRSO17 transposase
MLQRAVDGEVLFAWVAGDSGYGRDPDLRDFCHRQRLPYVLGVAVDLPLDGPPGKPDLGQPPIKRAADLLPYATRGDRWERRSCGEGAKGQRYYDWSVFAVTVTGQGAAEGFEHHLLIRRSTDKKQLAGGRFGYEVAYFLVHAPTGTPTADMIVQAGVRWKIEEDNEDGKQLVGLDQYQVRKWTPWHRHVTCAMLAQAFLVVQRSRHPDPKPPSADDAPPPAPRQALGKAQLAMQGTAPR